MKHPSFTPYYAVIFTSLLSDDTQGYAAMADEMHKLATSQQGFLGFESARNEIGISISYWDSLEHIQTWKKNTDHLMAQKLGREKWYQSYKVRICKVEREYDFSSID